MTGFAVSHGQPNKGVRHHHASESNVARSSHCILRDSVTPTYPDAEAVYVPAPGGLRLDART